MIEGLSEETQGLVNIAANISSQVKHYYIGVEHIFVACARLDRQTLEAALKAGGVSLEKCLKRLLECMSDAPALSTDGRMLITPRLGRIFDALKADGEVALERLLPLIFHEGRSLPCHVIREMDGDLAAIAAYLATSPIAASADAQERLAHSRTPALSSLGRDVTELAAEGKIDPVIGRDREIRQLALVLARKTKNNPVLIGKAGVGKTAIVEGLALRVAAGQVPPSLREKRIIELPLSVIVAGTQYRGQFEERLNKVVQEVRKNAEIILFIDEVHTMVGAGSSSSLDAANILKPALARGDLRCIGATTTEEYHRYVEPDAALERRFSPVVVRELSDEDTIAVLEGRREGYELHHGVRISAEAIQSAVRLAARHVLDRHMPDKALDLLDEACASASMARYMGEGMGEWLSDALVDEDTPPEVTAKDVASVLADRSGQPLEHLMQDENVRLEGLEAALLMHAVGQEAAMQSVVDWLRRLQHARDGAVGKARPASFIFAGSLGVGKRALALGLAQALFRDDALVSFDLAEYRDKIDGEKLLGAPPGYIGHDRESLLSRRLRRDQYVVITLENFEAGHPDVQDVFLRAWREGYVSDNQGRTVHVENAVVVILADLDDAGKRALGFGAAGQDAASQDKVLALLKDKLGQELFEQVDCVVHFPALALDSLTTLAQHGLERLGATAGPVIFDEELSVCLAQKALESGAGLRALDRLIRLELAGPMHEALMDAPPGAGQVLWVSCADGKLSFDVVSRPAGIGEANEDV